MIGEAAIRQHIIDVALAYKGTPFRFKGTRKGVGADCATFMGMTYIEAGLIEKITYPPYTEAWGVHKDEDRYMNELLKYLPFRPTSPQKGDVILADLGKSNGHGAIYIDEKTIIHCVRPYGVCRSSIQLFIGVKIKVFSFFEGENVSGIGK